MPHDARVTDVCNHGPMIITGALRAIDEGQPTSRIGDLYRCPIHGINPIITGAPHTIVENSRSSRVGDITRCGAVIITGARRCILG